MVEKLRTVYVKHLSKNFCIHSKSYALCACMLFIQSKCINVVKKSRVFPNLYGIKGNITLLTAFENFILRYLYSTK